MKFYFARGMIQMILTSGSSVGILWTWPGEEVSEEPGFKKIRECDERGMWENMNIMSNR